VHLTGLAVQFRAPVVHLMAANTRSPQGGTASGGPLGLVHLLFNEHPYAR